MSEQEPGTPPDDQGLGAAVQEVSERTVKLVQEEIELAKTELSEKFSKLLTGTVVIGVVSVFLFWAIAIGLFGLVYLINDLVTIWPREDVYWAFFVVFGLLLVLALLGGLIALRAFKAASPPVPSKAIEEAKKTKETFVADLSSDRDSDPDPEPDSWLAEEGVAAEPENAPAEPETTASALPYEPPTYKSGPKLPDEPEDEDEPRSS